MNFLRLIIISITPSIDILKKNPYPILWAVFFTVTKLFETVVGSKSIQAQNSREIATFLIDPQVKEIGIILYGKSKSNQGETFSQKLGVGTIILDNLYNYHENRIEFSLYGKNIGFLNLGLRTKFEDSACKKIQAEHNEEMQNSKRILQQIAKVEKINLGPPIRQKRKNLSIIPPSSDFNSISNSDKASQEGSSTSSPHSYKEEKIEQDLSQAIFKNSPFRNSPFNETFRTIGMAESKELIIDEEEMKKSIELYKKINLEHLNRDEEAQSTLDQSKIGGKKPSNEQQLEDEVARLRSKLDQMEKGMNQMKNQMNQVNGELRELRDQMKIKDLEHEKQIERLKGEWEGSLMEMKKHLQMFDQLKTMFVKRKSGSYTPRD